MAAYMNSVTKSELPPALRPLQGKHQKMLMARRTDILGALEDETLRGLVLQWLDDKPSGIARRDARTLAIVAAHGDDWEKRLEDEFPAEPGQATSSPDPGRALEREKERTRKAKDDAKRARDEAANQVAEARRQVDRLEQQLLDERNRSERAELALEDARKQLSALRSEMERELRKARRRWEISEAALAEAKAASRARPRAGEPPRPVRKERPKDVSAPKPEIAVAEPDKRTRLEAPRGRFEDDPETLAEWLARPHVHLLVDGYNVTKAEGGFGDLTLESQRNRVVQEVGRLARRHGIHATIVFDGSVVTPGTYRRGRGPVAVEYSRPDEIADDHLIAKLRALPKHPVVLVTNDKELQHRAARLGATIATSVQLLGLIRSPSRTV